MRVCMAAGGDDALKAVEQEASLAAKQSVTARALAAAKAAEAKAATKARIDGWRASAASERKAAAMARTARIAEREEEAIAVAKAKATEARAAAEKELAELTAIVAKHGCASSTQREGRNNLPPL